MSPNKSSSSSSSTNQKRILCVGMCVLDIIHVCEYYPVEDTDKRCLSGYWQRGGNASNNCTVLRQLKASCEFLGMLSESPAFGFLLDDCGKRGILIDNCPRTTQDPPFSSVLLNQSNGSRTIIHSNPNFPILTYEHFKGIDLNAYGWIHFEARNPDETNRMIKDILAFNEQNKNERIKISVELEKVKVDNLVLAEWADYVLIGKDLAQHLGWSTAPEAVKGLWEKLQPQKVANYKKPGIICTWGGETGGCIDSDGNYTEVAAKPVKEIVDSLGAGDTFCAAAIYALHILQLNLPKAVEFGNRIAAYKLQHRGYDAIDQLKLEF